MHKNCFKTTKKKNLILILLDHLRQIFGLFDKIKEVDAKTLFEEVIQPSSTSSFPLWLSSQDKCKDLRQKWDPNGAKKLVVHTKLGKQVCTMNGLKAKNQLCKCYLCSCSVTQSCPAPCDPSDYIPPGFCVHGIFKARILELVDISSPRGPSTPGDWTHCVLFISGGFFTLWAIKVSCTVMSNSLRSHGLCSPPGSSVHGILQVGVLEWVTTPFSRESSQHRDLTWVSCIAGRFHTNWAIGESKNDRGMNKYQANKQTKTDMTISVRTYSGIKARQMTQNAKNRQKAPWEQ